MINFRINLVEKENKIINCYIQQKRILFWRTLSYYESGVIGKELPLSTSYSFDSIKKAKDYILSKYRGETISIIKRKIIIN